MNPDQKLQYLIKLCRSDVVTDLERVVQAWRCCEGLPENGAVSYLSSRLAEQDAGILRASAEAVMRELHDDSLGVGIDYRPESTRFASRGFILALRELPGTKPSGSSIR